MGIFSDLGLGDFGGHLDGFFNKTVINPIETIANAGSSLIDGTSNNVQRVQRAGANFADSTAKAGGKIEDDAVGIADQLTEFFPFIALGVGAIVVMNFMKK